MRRSFQTLEILAAVLLAAHGARGSLILQSYDASVNDRFDTSVPDDYVGNPYDWSGVGMTASAHWATMISPQHFLSAAHHRPSLGSAVTFHHDNNPAGTWESRTVIAGTRIGVTDLWVGTLNSPVSSAVRIYPLVNDYLFTSDLLYVFGLAAMPAPVNMRTGLNQPDSLGYYSTSSATNWTFRYDFDVTGGTGASEAMVQPGDSGGPSFVLRGGQPVLAGIHWLLLDTNGDTIGDTSADSHVGVYRADILSEVPEPASVLLVVLGVSAAALARRREVIRRR